jgi:hypothetical protein
VRHLTYTAQAPVNGAYALRGLLVKNQQRRCVVLRFKGAKNK